jgi:hypothetical protein
MTIEFDCTEQDIRELNRFFVKTPAGRKEMLRNYALQSLLIYSILFTFLCILCYFSRVLIHPIIFRLAFFGAITLFIANIILRNQNQDKYTTVLIKRGNYSFIIGKSKIVLKPEGIEITTEHGVSLSYYNKITAIHETENHIYLQLSPVMFHLIPKAAFVSAEQGKAFLRQIEQYRTASTDIPVAQTTRGAWWTQGSSVTGETQANQSRF